MNPASQDAASLSRQALRQRLLEQREKFVLGPQASPASAALAHHLATLLSHLKPELLGAYWSQRCEFNAVLALATDSTLSKLPIALPFAQSSPHRMHYRRWDGQTPTAIDECGIPSSNGAPALPDVVLVPCVGFTAAGFRLGYGGGYFDRWLALHRQVTAIGVAWAVGEIDDAAVQTQTHDQLLTVIVTERGIV